jgi:hypothetical protein
VLDSLNLESDGFGIEPEITAKILKKKLRIREIPIMYKARAKESKKIGFSDGIKAFFILLKVRFG